MPRETFGTKAVVFIAATAFVAWGLSFLAIPIVQGNAQGRSPFDALCRALGLTAASVPTTATDQARPSNIVWNTAMLDRIAGGDTAKGAEIADAVCVSCHLANGQSVDPAATPSITGQSAKAIYKQLWDLKTSARASEVMKPIAEQLIDREMADVAAYYAALRGRNQNNPEATVVSPATTRLVLTGGASRALPPCAACHAPRAGGPLETPLLVGQYAPYVEAQLKVYANGARKNDLYARMRTIARKLTSEEIADISAYYNAPLAIH